MKFREISTSITCLRSSLLSVGSYWCFFKLLIIIPKNGAPISTLYEPLQHHDIIEFFVNRKVGILQKCPDMLKKGHSFASISKLTGYSESTIRQTLKRHNIKPKDVGSTKHLIQPPYGYAILNRELVKDPKEYEAVQYIMDFHKSGKTKTAIARALDAKGIKPRRSAKWSRITVRSIIERESAPRLKT